ncbi:MAG: C39 family peptidase, partial [Candidatus Sabulitectum sp.]|nr:C39 family peptidase [Candidatus Sabulitectum sp.]
PGNASSVISLPTDDPAVHFDVPYMHQRWDTPDWFNGNWSCGPTSCMMAVQYYNRLTPDSIWCSYPSGHWSEWGNYIPTEYTFLGYTYDIMGESAPGGVWVPGAHGFICRDIGGAIWAEMTTWMTQHSLTSYQLGTTWSACTGELDNSWTVVASTTSPYTGGHILLFNGYYDDHSVICNDSYGNQNLPGWGTLPNGKDVVYDWPGYNNGNTQLGVSQLFSARSEVLSPAGELIDDRSLGYRKLGPCQYWHEQETGYDGYSWWTYSTGALPDTCFVEWIPELSSEAWYLVETYVPSSHSTATGIYHINSSTGWVTATVNQGNYSDQWATVGTFFLSPSSAMVRMGDYTGTQSQHISFDAIRFTQQTSIDEQAYASESEYFTISQNPVHTASPIVFNLPDGFNGTIQIYDLTGRLALTAQSSVPSGSLAPGLYHAVLENETNVHTIRFTVIK